jgi:hypothetical protein
METPRAVETRQAPQLLLGMVALAVALVVSAIIGAGAFTAAKRAGDQIEVTGSAKRPIRSDFAVWRGSVATQAPDLAGAYAEVTRQAQVVRQFLAASGFADSLITVRPVETQTVFRVAENGMQTSDLLGYRLAQNFEVRSSDVAAVTALSQRATGLIDQGVPLQSSSPEYLYTKLNEVRTEMLAAATEDALRRAEAVAKSAGAEIGAVRSARQGVFQITARNSTEVSDYGINDTSSLEKDITAVVRVTFAVD